MELNINQAIQQAVAAHKEGKLEEAERLYRAILQTQPTHPDANHNLGVIAVSVNKTQAALPLLKTALDANPNHRQFWLSYIDALIKGKQFDNAKEVIDQGKKRGLASEKVDALSQQLTLITQAEESTLPEQKKSLTFAEKRKKLSEKKKKKKAKSPSQPQLSSLLEHYQNGRYGDAEKLALSMTKQFPRHQFSWKVLGAVLQETGRISEGLIASQKAVGLAPQDAEAHSNLGNTLKELGRSKDAEASYRKAIALKSDYAEAHNNLGNTLQELGRSKDAEASYRKAIALKPDYAEAHYNLGLLLSGAEQYGKAAEQFKLSTFGESKHYLLRCLYLQDEKSLFFDQLDYFINQGEIHPMIGSLGCRSALRYGIERPNLFCKDPLKYVLKTDLNNQYDFEKIFVKTTRTILNENRIPDKRQELLTNGRQTYGNLFDLEPDFTDEIQKIIRVEVDKYRFNFKDSEEGLIKNWPADYSMSGWLVSMRNGGELRPHMHSEGWISGSIYINVPPKLKTDSGNFVVCIEDETFVRKGVNNPKKIIDVVTGSLALFPASLLHYTIPFESEEARIVLAFDVVPK